MKNTTPKYSVGQTVHVIGEPEGVNGSVKGFSFDGEAFAYQISSQEVDVQARKLIDGVKTVSEDELESVTDQEEAK